MQPVQLSGRRERQFSVDEAQIVAVARTEHQPVLAERHRRVIAVAGGMADGEQLHGVPEINASNRGSSPQETNTTDNLAAAPAFRK
jgi:hypothetical protein